MKFYANLPAFRPRRHIFKGGIIAFGMERSANLKGNISDVIKATLLSVLISLALVLIFAIIIKFAALPSSVIMPVNIAIKVLSVFVGTLIGFKTCENGLIKGAITGAIYMLFTFFIFAALSGFKDVKFSWIDLATLPVAGAISGIIAVNIRRKN